MVTRTLAVEKSPPSESRSTKFETIPGAIDCFGMGWRYRRRLRIIPGVTINLGKTGFTSLSVGGAAAMSPTGDAGRARPSDCQDRGSRTASMSLIVHGGADGHRTP